MPERSSIGKDIVRKDNECIIHITYKNAEANLIFSEVEPPPKILFSNSIVHLEHRAVLESFLVHSLPVCLSFQTLTSYCEKNMFWFICN